MATSCAPSLLVTSCASPLMVTACASSVVIFCEHATEVMLNAPISITAKMGEEVTGIHASIKHYFNGVINLGVVIV